MFNLRWLALIWWRHLKQLESIFVWLSLFLEHLFEIENHHFILQIGHITLCIKSLNVMVLLQAVQTWGFLVELLHTLTPTAANCVVGAFLLESHKRTERVSSPLWLAHEFLAIFFIDTTHKPFCGTSNTTDINCWISDLISLTITLWKDLIHFLQCSLRLL